MELMEMILSQRNLEEAIKAVKSNKGAPGVDKMTVNEIDEYFKENMDEIMSFIEVELESEIKKIRKIKEQRSLGLKRA